MGDIPTRQHLRVVVANKASHPMNSADIQYLWRTGEYADQPLRTFLDLTGLAIDDRIPPRGLKDEINASK